MFPRDRVIASLAKYKIVYSEGDSDDVLRGRLAQFYAERTLLKQAVTPADQAEAVFLLLSNRLAKTTGQILSIDGGLHEAFLR
jgi:enoyl-[acyl-carrier-protein] reductase (NADH)